MQADTALAPGASTPEPRLQETGGHDLESLADTISDISSLFDDGESYASSNSSFGEIHKSVAEELTELLLSLDDIYDPALALLSTDGPKRFELVLGHFIFHFGVNLRREASSSTEISAANFVWQSRRRITACLLESLLQRPPQGIFGIKSTPSVDEERRARLDAWLKLHSSSEEGEWGNQNPEVDDTGIIAGLEGVKAFIIDSQALKVLINSSRSWTSKRGRLDRPEDEDFVEFEEEQNTYDAQDDYSHGHTLTTSPHDTENDISNTIAPATIFSEKSGLLNFIASHKWGYNSSVNTPIHVDRTRHPSLIGSLINGINAILIPSLIRLKTLAMTPNPPGSVKVAWKCVRSLVLQDMFYNSQY